MGVTAIIQPTCTSTPGTLEDIIVVITNFGTLPITSVPVSCSFNNGITSTASYIGSLPPLASDTFVFPAAEIIPAGDQKSRSFK